MNNKIFVITHKSYDFPNINIYCPLIVGANKNLKDNNNYYRDNRGVNITDKNSSFCELTGLYWINNNVDCDIVGLVHYRRYFYKHFFSNSFNNILDEDYIKRKLDSFDIIVPKKKFLIDGSVYNDYIVHHNEEDLKECINVLLEKYPEYKESLDIVMNRNYLYSFNMFITTKKIMNQYCEWLFDILFELEKRIDITDYDSYNKRVFGFLSERLFNIWLLYNNYSICEEYVFNIEENKFKETFINLVKRIALLPMFYFVTKVLISNKRKKE